MILEITKIIPYKKSQTEGVYLTLQMKDIKTGKFYQTYLVQNYRNYDRWRKIARLGNEIFFRNLKMKTENIVDADSHPLLLTGRRRDKIEPASPPDLEGWAKTGVFG